MKNTHLWLLDYLAQAPKRARLKCVAAPVHILFAITDHFEPRWGKVKPDQERARAERFLQRYGELCRRHKDARGVPPKYSFFYPIDEYSKECVDLVGDFCRQGLGEVEVHLHHDGDTAETLREKLAQAVSTYKAHGLLGHDKMTGADRYAFIHGNWSLCNSRPDGRWCGVNDELKILRATGCFADLTLPSAPSDTQTAKINSIYYATSTAVRPGGHNTGLDAAVGRSSSGDLLLIQGPLMLNWKRFKIESGSLTSTTPVTPDRIRLWVEAGVSVVGQPNWRFVKIHNHGCRDDHQTEAFFADLDQMFTQLENDYCNGRPYVLHYVTAREMYNVVRAAEAGQRGDPALYRDYEVISNIATK